MQNCIIPSLRRRHKSHVISFRLLNFYIRTNRILCRKIVIVEKPRISLHVFRLAAGVLFLCFMQ